MGILIDFIGVLGFLVAIISSAISYRQFKLHRKQMKAELLSKYSARYCIDPDIKSVVKFLEQQEGLVLHKQADKPDDHEVEMFMRFFEELELLIRAKSIDENVASYMFFYYLQTFSKIKDNWKNIDYESEDWKIFHEFIERMKRVRKDKNNYKID